MLPRLVATDLDGTLLCSDGTSPNAPARPSRRGGRGDPRRALHRTAAAAVAPVAGATGHRGIAVCSNGGVIWDLHTESVVEEFPLRSEIAWEVVARLQRALPDATWAVERHDGFAREPATSPTGPFPATPSLRSRRAAASRAAAAHGPSSAGDRRRAPGPRARADRGARRGQPLSSAQDALLEISAPGVSKASSLAVLCERSGIESRDVVAFGDMPNDLPMLTWAGHGVAVANAHEDVLAAADEVTASNDEAGVAQVLERLLEQAQ